MIVEQMVKTQTKTMVLGGVKRLEQTAVFLWTDAVSAILHKNVYHSGLGPSG